MNNEILKEAFPQDIKEMIFEGLLVPYKHNITGHLMARDRYFKFVYIFDDNNEYKKTLYHFNLNNYSRCKLDIDSQVRNLFSFASDLYNK